MRHHNQLDQREVRVADKTEMEISRQHIEELENCIPSYIQQSDKIKEYRATFPKTIIQKEFAQYS